MLLFGKFGDVTTTKSVTLGVYAGRGGDVSLMTLPPYSVLKVPAMELPTRNSRRTERDQP